MLECSLICIVLVGMLSFVIRLYQFNHLPEIQRNAYENFKKIDNGVSLNELNDLLGKKGKKMFNSSHYRWYFGDSIIVKDKFGNIESFAEYMSDIMNWRNYNLFKNDAYIDVDMKNGKSCFAEAVGLN